MGVTLQQALRVHDQAARALLTTANEVPAARWSEPLGDGRWTPAQIMEHLIATYEVVLRELAGGAGMRVRTSLWQRVLLRLTLLPRIMRGGGFPKHAPAPRELRPGEGVGRDEGLARFEQKAKEFDIAAKNARADQQVTHAYFGSSTVANGVLLCARHIEHHTAQLPTKPR